MIKSSKGLPSNTGGQPRSNIKVAVRIRPVLEDEKARGLVLDPEKLSTDNRTVK
jgi:hypothetical protein